MRVVLSKSKGQKRSRHFIYSIFMGKNLNNEKISLVWSYTPIDYFEEIFRVQKDEYELEFRGGNIKVTLDTMFYQQNKGIIDKILSDIDTYFVGVQVVSHKAYKIEKHIMHSYNAKGGRGLLYLHHLLK